jgi:hypothetical protein
LLAKVCPWFYYCATEAQSNVGGKLAGNLKIGGKFKNWRENKNWREIKFCQEN